MWWPSLRGSLLWWAIALLIAINLHTFMWWHQHDLAHHVPLPPTEVICPPGPPCPLCPGCLCPICKEPQPCPECPAAIPTPKTKTPKKQKPEAEPELRDMRPVWYFHHMPKCAGTSVERSMRSAARDRRFATAVVRDDGIKGPVYGRPPLKRPQPGSVLTGHWCT